MKQKMPRGANTLGAVIMLVVWPGAIAGALPTATDACLPASYLFFFNPGNADLSGPDVDEFRKTRAMKLLVLAAKTWSISGGEVLISGHEDDAEVVQGHLFGKKRNDALKAELVKMGIDSSTILTIDLGATSPIFPQPAGIAEEQNRYAEVRIENAAKTCIRDSN